MSTTQYIRRLTMPMYKITATIEVTTEAEDESEALDIGEECLDWSNADITVEETDDDD
tara:strand:- start:375 stop:548 length:174 start_codon:yes stop_codon:yes gene_type:complete